MRVHLSVGGDYLADLRAVRQDAEQATDRARSAGEFATGVSREIHYAFILGSITDIAAHIPPALLARLVADRLWSAARALAYALTTPDSPSRAAVLGALAPHLPPDLLAQALNAAIHIDNPSSQARALGALTPHLPPTNAARCWPGC